jgi:pantothenate kinase type III
MPEEKTTAQRIAELQAQIDELRSSEPRPLTPAEIRALTPEEAQQRWEELRAQVAQSAEPPARPHDDDVQATGVDRIAKAYANSESGGQR